MNLIMPPAAPSLQIGGRVVTDLTNLIYLSGASISPTNINTTLRLNNGSAGYQVPVGRTLRIFAVRITAVGFSATMLSAPLYSDNDVGIATATVYTNAKFIGNDSNMAYMQSMTSLNHSVTRDLTWDIPAGKYPSFTITNGTGQILVEAWGSLL